MRPLGEFEIIREFFEGHEAGRDDIAIGVGDDGAVLCPPAGKDLVQVVDALVAGIHFPIGLSPRAVGHRALAVNLSDMAAMGAKGAWATLALSLPDSDEHWLADFAAGFFELARRHDVALVGGDTVRGPLEIVVQVTGFVDHGKALRRSGGSPGDAVFVSGTLGDAAAGLRRLHRTGEANPLAQRFLYPQPRCELGQQLIGWASAVIDVSDGLAADLARLLQASNCGGRFCLHDLPLSEALTNVCDTDESRYLALHGGDDYELLFAIPADRVTEFERIAPNLPTPVAKIGTLEEGDAVSWFDDGTPVTVAMTGYDHFDRAGD